MSRVRSILLLGTGLVCFAAVAVGDEPTAREKAEVRRIKSEIDKAGRFFNDDKLDASVRAVESAQKRCEKLLKDADEDLIKLLRPEYARLKKAHEVLQAKGKTLPKLVALAVSKIENAESVSFVKAVAPILNAKCGRCHVSRASGRFSMANFDTLIRGPREGVVIMPGKADDSRLIEVIVEGDMPRGGLRVSEEELATLKQWITEGAKFDGEDRSQGLAELAGDDAPRERTRLEVTKSTGNETVSFSLDVAPSLVASCSGCHVNARRVRGGLNMDNFQALLRGGDSGPMIQPGKGEESLLIKKLRGTGGGQRMPVNRPALKDEVIDKISQWIDEGATFDGESPRTDIRTLAARAKASAASHEELTADRERKAMADWKMVMSDIPANQVKSENMLIVGQAESEALREFAELAETLIPKIKSQLKASKKSPSSKARSRCSSLNGATTTANLERWWNKEIFRRRGMDIGNLTRWMPTLPCTHQSRWIVNRWVRNSRDN